MMNKKFIALLLAVSAISSISAHYEDCYVDKDTGVEHCREVRRHHLFGRDCRDDECYDGPVRGTGRRVGETIEDTGRTARDAANTLTLGIFE